MNKRLLVISICLNVALAFLCISKSRGPEKPSISPWATDPPRALRSRAADENLAPQSHAAPEPITWARLESEDLKQYAQNLRDVGCPKGTIYDIISDRVFARFRPRIKAVVEQVLHRFYEEMAACKGDITELAKPQQEQLEEISGQLEEALKEALDESRHEPDENVAALERRSAIASVVGDGDLPAVSEIQDRYSVERDKARVRSRSSIEQRAALEELDQREAAELRTLLSEQQVIDLQLRRHSYIKDRRPDFEATPEEWRSMLGIARDCARTNNNDTENIEAAIAQWLGPERGAGFQAQAKPEYRGLIEVCSEAGLPNRVAEGCYEIRQECDRAQQRIRKQPLPQLVKKWYLSRTFDEARAGLRELLGEEAAEAYEWSHGEWLAGK